MAVRPCVGGIREARVKHKLGAHTQNRRKANGGKADAGRCQFTGEAGPASAVVSAGHISAGPSIHARVGFTLVVVDVTVASAPARVACAFVAKAQTEICIVDCVSRRAPPSLFCELGHMVKVLGGLTR